MTRLRPNTCQPYSRSRDSPQGLQLSAATAPVAQPLARPAPATEVLLGDVGIVQHGEEEEVAAGEDERHLRVAFTLPVGVGPSH